MYNEKRKCHIRFFTLNHFLIRGINVMAREKKDLLGQIGNDILKVVVNRVVPKPNRRGRPKKRSLEDILANLVTGSKIVLPTLGALVLMNKGILSFEQFTMVGHYVAANRDTLTIPELYPSSPKWVVKKALEEFGLDASTAIVSWDEIVNLVATAANMYEQAQSQQTAAGVAGQKAGANYWTQENVNAFLANIQGLQGTPGVAPGGTGSAGPGKSVDTPGKTG